MFGRVIQHIRTENVRWLGNRPSLQSERREGLAGGRALRKEGVVER